MSTQTLAPAARRHVALYSSGILTGFHPQFKRVKYAAPKMVSVDLPEVDGDPLEPGEEPLEKLVVTDMPVFRSGTFRDSDGYQHTWEPLHIDQMVSNFTLLRDRGIFPDVPVRDGHPGWILAGMEGNGKVAGYHTGLRAEDRTNPVDGETYRYLIADFEILDCDAMDAVESGLWRNRSAEVGPYVTNNESEFFPTYQGFAYVDIPAVEGLNAFSKNNPGLGTTFSLMFEADKETPVAPENTPEGTAPVVPVPPVPPVAVVPPVTPPVPPVEDELVETIVVNDDGTVTVTDAEGVVVRETIKELVTASKNRRTSGFKINGQTVSDFAAVQAHISVLEAAQVEQVQANRKAFVKSLVDDQKVTGPQQAALEEFALGLSPEQYSKWCEGYSLAPKLTLFAVHAAGVTNPEGQNDEGSDFEIARDIVASHKRAGMSDEVIKQTPSYSKLIAHDPTFTL